MAKKRKVGMTHKLTRAAKADVKEVAEGLYNSIHKKLYRYSDAIRKRHGIHGDATRRIVSDIKRQIVKTMRVN